MMHTLLRLGGDVLFTQNRAAYRRARLALPAVLALAVVTLLATPAWTSSERLIYTFEGGADGGAPSGGLITDSAGNLYGTSGGGIAGAGMVFKLSPMPDGSWTKSVLYAFTGGADGEMGIDGIVFDAAGNLYGATYSGGTFGNGTIFQLIPNLDGSWSKNILHNFGSGNDGAFPITTPVFDAAGNLYGTTSQGGVGGCGTVFRLAPGPENQWTFKVIHQLKGSPACISEAGLTVDAAGNLYGTTRNEIFGCDSPPLNCGTVFKLTPGPDNNWTLSVIHKFKGLKQGADPYLGGVVFDAEGVLYGTVGYKGAHGDGLLFSLTPRDGQKWDYKILHQFREDTEGAHPAVTLRFDAAGNFYGATQVGGLKPHGGAFFEMTHGPDGWVFSVLHDFGSKSRDPHLD
jgi:uncharacterized repeat protein (TIGR03803 family)